MNMQHKLYTIQSSHHLVTDSQSVPKQWSWNAELKIMQNSWKISNSRIREDSNSRKREEPILAPWPTPIYKVYGMEYFHWPGWLAAWLWSLPDPAHLLINWTWETGKSPWVIETTENISVTNILLILHSKHSSYWEKN